MRRSLRVALVSFVAAAVAVLGASASVPEASAAGDAGASSLPGCVQVTTQSRYVPFGYNHVVDVKNGCSKTATCRITTDVNPTATSVEVAPGVTSEVVTYVASPSQTFVAHVTCTLQ